jgi:Tfp pilus assembly protein PilF
MMFAVALPLVFVNCNQPPKLPPEGGYHTVTVDPQRDTDKAKQFNRVGMDYLDKEQLDQAVAAFIQALDADVEFGPAHNNLGKVYYKQKEWYKAAWEFEYAIHLLPRFAEPQNNLGLVLEESGQIDKAVEQYRMAVGLSGDIEYRANLARGLIRREGRTDEVRALLLQVVAQDTRPQWRDWARKELSVMGVKAP